MMGNEIRIRIVINKTKGRILQAKEKMIRSRRNRIIKITMMIMIALHKNITLLLS